MNLKSTGFAAVLLLGNSGSALAQSTTNTVTPPNAPTISPSSPSARDPGVNPNAAGTSMVTRDYGASSNPSANAPHADEGLERGANSFTEQQARRRIEDHGFSNVGELHKDQNAIWQAEATKNG